jgi:hypothetical protein
MRYGSGVLDVVGVRGLAKFGYVQDVADEVVVVKGV